MQGFQTACNEVKYFNTLFAVEPFPVSFPAIPSSQGLEHELSLRVSLACSLKGECIVEKAVIHGHQQLCVGDAGEVPESV